MLKEFFYIAIVFPVIAGIITGYIFRNAEFQKDWLKRRKMKKREKAKDRKRRWMTLAFSYFWFR